MYFTNQNPTEHHYQRHGLLLQEAHITRLARQPRAAHRMGAPEKERE